MKTGKSQLFLLVILVIWLGIPIVDNIGKNFLDIQFFAFREWEPMTARRRAGPFVPSTRFEKEIYGDLANILKARTYRQYRHQIFTTDSYGFRNPYYQEGTYFPIVVVGDSDMAGSSLSDEQTFSYQLEKRLGAKVYNYAPMSPISFFSDKRFMENPPKILIWEGIERTITGKNYGIYAKEREENLKAKSGPSALPEVAYSLPLLSTFYAQQIFNEVRWYLTGVHSNYIGYIDEKSKMLFYMEGISMLKYSAIQRNLETVVKGIENIDKLCKKRNIVLIYMPLPDKENIYRDYLPKDLLKNISGSSFLEELHSELKKKKIINVDLYSRFKPVAMTRPLYFLDDTHWGPAGVIEAAELTTQIIEEENLLWKRIH